MLDRIRHFFRSRKTLQGVLLHLQTLQIMRGGNETWETGMIIKEKSEKRLKPGNYRVGDR